jgi:protein TonB
MFKIIDNLGKAAIVLSGCFVMGLTACNMDNKNNQQAISSPADSLANMSNSNNPASDTSSAKAVKPELPPKKKKGKASVAMTSSGSTENKMTKDKYGIYTNPSVMPAYPGGSDALESYIDDHIDYNQQAVDENTNGRTVISFVVDEKGNVSNVKQLGPKVGNGLDEQAIKAIQDMPKWTPGKVKGKEIKSRVDLPISFQIE